MLSNSDGQNNDNDNNNTTMLLLKKVKTTHDKKLNANKLTKDGECNNNWVNIIIINITILVIIINISNNKGVTQHYY